jgi:hypothetical protein
VTRSRRAHDPVAIGDDGTVPSVRKSKRIAMHVRLLEGVGLRSAEIRRNELPGHCLPLLGSFGNLRRSISGGRVAPAPPAAHLRIGHIWYRREVERWANGTGRLPRSSVGPVG